MAGEEPNARRSDYRAARIGAAGAFVGCIVIVILADAVSVDYDANLGILTLLSGLVLGLLGLEVKSIVGGNGK